MKIRLALKVLLKADDFNYRIITLDRAQKRLDRWTGGFFRACSKNNQRGVKFKEARKIMSMVIGAIASMKEESQEWPSK